jgi:hypothetical protein
MPPSGITASGTLLRIGLALALVIGTFNPTGYSLFHWITEAPVAISPVKALAVLALAIGWVVCLRTEFISLGRMGLVLALALSVLGVPRPRRREPHGPASWVSLWSSAFARHRPVWSLLRAKAWAAK